MVLYHPSPRAGLSLCVRIWEGFPLCALGVQVQPGIQLNRRAHQVGEVADNRAMGPMDAFACFLFHPP